MAASQYKLDGHGTDLYDPSVFIMGGGLTVRIEKLTFMSDSCLLECMWATSPNEVYNAEAVIVVN